MLVYNPSYSCIEPFNIVFICGSKYNKYSINEKRNILKDFLQTKIKNCRAVILEENFIFGKTNMEFLAYDEIFLKGLAQVEELASLYANKIIIIHETISTAAEIGMFASNPFLYGKICLLVPDDISIEEEKNSGFIKLAFLNKKAKNTLIKKCITYYPDVEVKRLSCNKSDYYTYFHNNEIGENLGKELISFVKNINKLKHFQFKKSLFKKPTDDSTCLDYFIDTEQNNINAYIHTDILKNQLLALFFIKNI